MSKEPYLALYRKYRPQAFDDVEGQEDVVKLLSSVIQEKKISHAYLFCGGRGTGKTTVARIVARDIGCNPEDVIEIDAASNRGIDEIRALREAVRTMPFSSPYKVYIIDEAHMLTKEAANALLKTLEEPPAHVVFILATTDPEKLPQTILSRCQKVIFKQPNLEMLTRRLSHVAKQEGYTVETPTLELIAKHGKGSYRDALSLLEQTLSISSKKVNHDDVMKSLGISEKELLIQLLEAVCLKDERNIVSIIQKNTPQGNALRAYDDFIELVRQGLIIRIGDTDDNEKELSRLAKEHPLTIGSKMLMELLKQRYLLEVSEDHSWVAFTAILLSLVEA